MVKRMDQPQLEKSVGTHDSKSTDAPPSSSKEWMDNNQHWPQPHDYADWPQPNAWDHNAGWKQQKWYQWWSQPRWDTWEVNHTCYQPQKAAASWWDTFTNGETHHHDNMAAASSASTAVATETSPVDLLQAQQQNDYWNDVEFLEKHEEKDRQRRRAHRFNLMESRRENSHVAKRCHGLQTNT